MNIQEYLKQCSVRSVDELTDEQVIKFYADGNLGIGQKCAVTFALEGKEISRNRILHSARKALKERCDFVCRYIENESAFGPTFNKTGWIVEP